ncbi:MAG: hypothetical protein ACI9JR_001962 [Gammaproteobacteria bacterium]
MVGEKNISIKPLNVEEEIILEEVLETLKVKGYGFLVASNVEAAVEITNVTTNTRSINQQFN